MWRDGAAEDMSITLRMPRELWAATSLFKQTVDRGPADLVRSKSVSPAAGRGRMRPEERKVELVSAMSEAENEHGMAARCKESADGVRR